MCTEFGAENCPGRKLLRSKYFIERALTMKSMIPEPPEEDINRTFRQKSSGCIKGPECVYAYGVYSVIAVRRHRETKCRDPKEEPQQ